MKIHSINFLLTSLLLFMLSVPAIAWECEDPKPGECYECRYGIWRTYGNCWGGCPDCQECEDCWCTWIGNCWLGCPDCESCINCYCECSSLCCDDSECPWCFECVDCVCKFNCAYVNCCPVGQFCCDGECCPVCCDGE